jgi:aryl-alcohol dehydrogenase-like predicted oxidoreductase/Pyruvate/2-oxoacid:ferredoxin oxidoreductase delta subunit
MDKMKKNKLGQTDLYVSPVGIGVLTVGKTQLNLSLEEGAALVQYALSSGINFLDTAEYYETYEYIRLALDKLAVASKVESQGNDSNETISGKILQDLVVSSKSLTSSYEHMRRAIEACIAALNRPSIEIFLMHEVRGRGDYLSRAGARQALIDAKKDGRVRYIGISSHHVDAVEMAAGDEEMDVVFPLINKNSLGIRTCDENGEERFASKSEMEAAIEISGRNGKGIFLMKVLGGGNLAKDYVEMMDYASGIKGVSSLMLGMGSRGDVDTAISYARGELSRAYVPDVSDKRIQIDKGDCEGCGACVARCPNKAIFMNGGVAEVDHKICLTCGYCAPVCPVRAIIMF